MTHSGQLHGMACSTSSQHTCTVLILYVRMIMYSIYKVKQCHSISRLPGRYSTMYVCMYCMSCNEVLYTSHDTLQTTSNMDEVFLVELNRFCCSIARGNVGVDLTSSLMLIYS